MAKPALGRGLGKLLEGDGIAGRPADDVPRAPAPSAPVSAGVGSLLRGQASGKAAQTQPTPVSPARKVSRLKISLLVADALLCVLAILFVTGKSESLSSLEGVVCSLAVGVAAWLGCQAWLLDRKPD